MSDELATRHAAEMLNVAHDYLLGLLDGGVIPCRGSGVTRLIRRDDLDQYRARRDEDRRRTLDALTEMSQEMGGYEELP